MLKKILFVAVLLFVVMLSTAIAFAGHNGAVVSYVTADCGQTTFSATVADPAGGHKVSNMRLVVSVNGVTQNVVVPVDGSSASITVGPFFENTTISWNVFGGGERAYDQPLWNGYGGPTFSADVNAYATAQGGFGWVVAGPEDPNPFVNWNGVPATGCPLTKDQCKNDGWVALGFRNQGLCIQEANRQSRG